MAPSVVRMCMHLINWPVSYIYMQSPTVVEDYIIWQKNVTSKITQQDPFHLKYVPSIHFPHKLVCIFGLIYCVRLSLYMYDMGDLFFKSFLSL